MEILNHSTKVAMDYPIVTYLERGLGHKFMTAEALWILTGKNTVKDISQYSNMISKFSDDGYYFHGAYGPKLVDQFTYNAIKYSKNNTWADYVEKLDLIIENYKKEMK